MSPERDLREYLRVLRRRWLMVVSMLVVCVGAAAALAWTRPPAYTASTQLFVSASAPSGNPTQSYEGGLFAQQRVLSYISIVSSPLVVQAALNSLGYHDSVAQVQREISASVPTGTVLLNVSVSYRSARGAKAIVNAVSVAFIRFIQRLETPRAGQPSYVNVSVISPARLPTAPSSPRKPLYLALGAFLGLVLGIGAAAVRDSLNDRPGRGPVGDQAEEPEGQRTTVAAEATESRVERGDLAGRARTMDGVEQPAGSTVADSGAAEYRHDAPTEQTVRDGPTEPAAVADTSRHDDHETAAVAGVAAPDATDTRSSATDGPREEGGRASDDQTGSTKQPATDTAQTGPYSRQTDVRMRRPRGFFSFLRG